MLTDDQVKHVAKLARIALKDEEVSRFAKQLSAVFEYMEILNEVDTEDVEITNQVTGLGNVMRKDEVCKSKISKDELLNCSELPKDSGQIRVLPTIK